VSEQDYLNGRRSAMLSTLRHCLRELATEDVDLSEARAVAVLAETKLALRNVCKRHGCDDWPDDLHPADVLEKHLGRLLDSLVDDG